MASLLKHSNLLVCVISYTALAKSRERGFTLKAPLIHWSSPESPYYRPNTTAVELLRASVQASRARAQHITHKLSGKYSTKWAVSPVTFTIGEFVMRFSVGTPPFETYAIPDTGSDIFWLQCRNCVKCYRQPDPPFDPKSSNTYKTLQCHDPDCKRALGDDFYKKCSYLSRTCEYLSEYLDGTYSQGVISEDVFTFNEDLAPFGKYTVNDTIFGCGLNNSQGVSGFDNYDAPGIIGLTSEPSSLVSQLTLGHQKLFSYCIALPQEGKQNSNIDIRFGIAASVSGHSTALATDTTGLYIFRDVDGLYSEGEKIRGPAWAFRYRRGSRRRLGILMDTGTTHTRLYKTFLDNLVRVLNRQIEAVDYADRSNLDFPLCYMEEDWEEAYIPSIELRFKNSTTRYPFTVANTWISNGRGQYCLDFIRSDDHTTLGMHQQRGIKFGYDVEANTVSFVETNNCDPF